jgi:cation:H+ antiporter
MTLALDLLRLVFGAALLYFGAEWLVRGASGLALAFRVKPLVVGLTVVAYGTSAPELTVSVAAALEGRGVLALGNAIGSNIANLGLILGLTALISPPTVDGRLIRREVPVLVISSALPIAFLYDGAIGRLEGVLLLGGAVGFTIWMLRVHASPSVQTAAGAAEDAEAAGAPHTDSRPWLAVLVVVGLAVLVGGGKLFVDGAVGIARTLGVSDRVVGLTIVAVGTSLPELAASLVAALRGHSAIAVGNVVGSNIFNVLLILGSASAVSPIETSLHDVRLDVVALVGMTLLGSVFLRTARTIRRWEGAVLTVAYFIFLVAVTR